MNDLEHATSLATPATTSVDAISSVVSRLQLPVNLRLGHPDQIDYGQVVAARVRIVNLSYPVLETTGGQGIRLREGMKIVGALGARRALHGFSGRLPARLGPGAVFHLLNKGGVMGECTAFHRALGWPAELEYLGTVHHGGRFLGLRDGALPSLSHSLPRIPVILVLGTCMNSGKTAVCKQILRLFSQKGFNVNAGKVAGVAACADLEAMRKSGAGRVLSFNDLGLPSSAHLSDLSTVARSLVHHLSSPRPDFTLLEAGDGILGGYHVDSLLHDDHLLERIVSVVLCANDLMGVWGSLEWLRQQGHDPQELSLLVSGPATDSAEGIRYIERHFRVPAANAFESSGKLCTFILKRLIPWSRSA